MSPVGNHHAFEQKGRGVAVEGPQPHGSETQPILSQANMKAFHFYLRYCENRPLGPRSQIGEEFWHTPTDMICTHDPTIHSQRKLTTA
jgi:hypothetical protein